MSGKRPEISLSILEQLKQLEVEVPELPEHQIVDTVVVPRSTSFGSPYLSPFERAQVISHRATMLGQFNKPSTIKTRLTNPIEIAKLELRRKKIPITLIRTSPNGSIQEIDVNTLILNLK